MAAVNVSGISLNRHRIAVLGAGSAGCGISSLLLSAMVADGLPENEARKRFFLVDRSGLLLHDTPGILPFQKCFAQARSDVAGWQLKDPNRIGLLDVVQNARPTVLIGVSGQPGGFSEDVVRLMAKQSERPVIFPLSNPTSRCEAVPTDLLEWSEGRAIIGTGSPFPPVFRNGHHHHVDQTNNAYVFPGLSVGAIVARARYISDGMLMAAARALAECSPARRDAKANLLPPIEDLRHVSYRVALAVAVEAEVEGLAQETSHEPIEARIESTMWSPVYRPYRRKS